MRERCQKCDGRLAIDRDDDLADSYPYCPWACVVCAIDQTYEFRQGRLFPSHPLIGV